MSRRSLIGLSFLMLVGCQAKPAQVAPHHPAQASLRPTTVAPAEREYDAVPAAALVFDPPVTMDDAPLELSRADREPRVSLGYEGPTVETFYIRTDDRQSDYGFGGGGRGSGRFRGGSNFDQFDRQAITERSGIRYR